MLFLSGLLCNLFSLPIFVEKFPFIGNHNNFEFNGYYYIENMIGGLFILSPICFLNFTIMKLKKSNESKEVKFIIRVLFIIGMIMAILSVCMAGSNQRYIVDYAWILMLSGIMLFLAIYMGLNSNEAKKIMEKAVIIISIYTIIINIAAGIISEKNDVKSNSPKEFYNMEYTVCFWE